MRRISNAQSVINTFWERYKLGFWLELAVVIGGFVSAFIGLCTLILYLNQIMGEPV